MEADSNELPLPGRRQVLEEASMWLSRMNRGLRPGEVPALRIWLEHPEHRQTILRAARLRHGPEIIAVLAELFPNGPEPMETRFWRPLLTAAAAVGGAAALAALLVTGEQPWSNIQAAWTGLQGHQLAQKTYIARARYTTKVGERREIQLPDGSRITLNTGTGVVVMYSIFGRNIYLPYGEASFHVLSAYDAELTVKEGNVKVFYTPIRGEYTAAQARLRANMTFDDTTVGALETALVEPGLEFVRKVEARDVDGLLAALRQEFRIDSRRDGQGHVVLTALRRDPAS